MLQRFQKREKVLIPTVVISRRLLSKRKGRGRAYRRAAREVRVKPESHRVEPRRRGGGGRGGDGGGGVVEEGRGGGGGESCHFDRHFSAEERPLVV